MASCWCRRRASLPSPLSESAVFPGENFGSLRSHVFNARFQSLKVVPLLPWWSENSAKAEARFTLSCAASARCPSLGLKPSGIVEARLILPAGVEMGARTGAQRERRGAPSCELLTEDSGTGPG